MKLKLVIIGLVVVMFFNVFSSIMVDTSTALGNKNYKLVVENCDYDLIKTVGNGPQTTFDFYKVAFTLHNEGPEDSDNIIVSIQESREDDKERVYRSGVIPAGESKTFHFGNPDYDDTQWILQATNTGKSYRHKVYVNYYPAENTTKPSELNSGNYSFLIGATKNNDSPGFELIIVFVAIFAIAYWHKKRRKK